MHDAAQYGHTDIIRLLAKYRGDINARNTIGITPLKAAAQNDELECVKVLLELGADVHAVSKDTKEGILHNAKSIAVARLLLEAGADVNAADKERETPLHHAIINGFTELAVYLIEQGAGKQIKNKYGETPIDMARERLDKDDLARVLYSTREQ